MYDIRYHPGGSLLGLAAGSQHTVLLFSADGKELKSKLTLPIRSDERKSKEKFTLAIAFSPDGSKIAASDMTGGVYVFDAQEGTMLTSLEGHVKPVRGLCFGGDSKTLLSASDDAHVHSYDLADGKLINAYSGHQSWVRTSRNEGLGSFSAAYIYKESFLHRIPNVSRVSHVISVRICLKLLFLYPRFFSTLV